MENVDFVGSMGGGWKIVDEGSDDDWEYRDWLMYTGIEGITGTLDSKEGSEGGLHSLSTVSLEKLYKNLRNEDPKEAYKNSFHMASKDWQ